MKSVLSILALLAVPSLASAQDEEKRERRRRDESPPPALVIVPRVTLFNADVRGRVRADEASFPSPILDGTSVRFDSDLDLDDSDPLWIVEILCFHRGEGRYLERASVSWFEADYDGEATLDSTEDFNGRTFTAGTRVESEVRYRSLGADFSVVDGDALGFENATGSVLIGLRHTDLRISMSGGGQQTDERLRLLWLGAGLRGESQWGRFSGLFQAAAYFTFGEFDNWVDLQFEEWGGVLVEAQAGVAATFGMFHLEGGWRIISNTSYAERDETDKFEDNDFSFQLSGPYLSATLRF